jgi:endonuclease YncB( thermonuclease family)
MRPASLALLVVMLATPALADPAFTAGDSADANVEVARIVDAKTLVLKDARTLRLADIDVPPRGAVAAQAKAALAELIDGQTLTLKFAGDPKDRQGRMLVEVYAGERWVQGELLRRGVARVAGTAGERIGIPEMLALERQARRYRRGLWADPAEAIVSAPDAGRRAGSFALVTGTVAGVITSANGIVLFFGADQHNGLTLTFAPDIVKLCRDAGLDPAALKGKTLLTRGYIDGTRRPTIAITFPEQIELLKNAAARQKKAAPKSLPGPPS